MKDRKKLADFAKPVATPAEKEPRTLKREDIWEMLRGEDGKTPKKGEDFFTDEDIKEIVGKVMEGIMLPKDGLDGLDGKDGVDGKDGKDGKDADENIIISRVLDLIRIPKDGKDADEAKIVKAVTKEVREALRRDFPSSAKDIVKKIVESEEKIPVKAIEGLEKKLESHREEMKSSIQKNIRTTGGQTALNIKNNGTSIGQVETINFKNTTITRIGDGREIDVTPAGGSASPLTTKGDLYGYSTTDARIPVGANGTVLTADSAEALGVKWAVVSGTGDVVGPASSTDNAIARFDLATGKLIQNSGVTISDTNVVLIPSLTASEMVITDASKNLVSAPVATYPSLTELTYVKGVTSAIQTQLNAKGTGNVSKVGTPVNNQIGVWTGDGTLEGDAALTFDTTTDTLATTLITATTVTANLVGNVTGNVSGSSGSTTGNAATVTTNANLTGPVTSVGNATAIADGALSTAKTSGLQAALDAKEATANKDATGGYAGLTLLKLNLKNAANTFTNFLTNATTAARTWTFPDKDGTVAMLSDITGTNSGTNTGDQTITLTGDVTGSGTGSFAATLATVNANVGSFGSATAAPTFTVNAKGLLTAAGSTTITPAVGSITGLGTGVATALGVNVGSAGAFTTFNGALGTPSSLSLTNATGLPVAGITSSTTQALGVGSLELGHATDTTISRSAAGQLAVEGVQVLTASNTVTVSGKTNVQRINATTDGATVTFDLSLGNIQTVTLGGNRTLAFSNTTAGQCVMLELKQDATGTRTVTWPAGISWAGGVAPTLTTTINKTDAIGIRVVMAGSAYIGYVVGANI